MNNILGVKVMEDYIHMCEDGVRQGWHERNGGNLTYRMRPEEVAECRPWFKKEGRAVGSHGRAGRQPEGRIFYFHRKRKIPPECASGAPEQHLYRGDQRGGGQLPHRLGTGAGRTAHQRVPDALHESLCAQACDQWGRIA